MNYVDLFNELMRTSANFEVEVSHKSDPVMIKMEVPESNCKMFIEDVMMLPKPIRVIHNEPSATITFWNDNTKTIVRCQDGEPYDKEKGLALCYMKKLYGNTGKFNEVLKKFC